MRITFDLMTFYLLPLLPHPSYFQFLSWVLVLFSFFFGFVFRYGTRLLQEGNLEEAGDIIVVLFTSIIGASGIGLFLGILSEFYQARVSCAWR
jgi:hypothetical protein